MDGGSMRVALWAGPAIGVALALALIPMSGFFPPPSPAEPAQYYSEYYREHIWGVRLAAVFFSLGGALYAPFFGAWALIVKRLEGGSAGVWTFTLLLASSVASCTFFLSGVFFGVAAFRPEQSPELQQLLNDLAWIELVVPAIPATIQALAIAIPILTADRAAPPIPRWVGYANLWLGILFAPGMLVVMWKTGPFAWNGLLSFWIPAVFFLVWLVLLTVQGLKVIRSPG